LDHTEFIKACMQLCTGMDYSYHEYDKGGTIFEIKLSTIKWFVIEITCTLEIGLSIVNPRECDFSGADKTYNSFETALQAIEILLYKESTS